MGHEYYAGQQINSDGMVEEPFVPGRITFGYPAPPPPPPDNIIICGNNCLVLKNFPEYEEWCRKRGNSTVTAYSIKRSAFLRHQGVIVRAFMFQNGGKKRRVKHAAENKNRV